MKPDMIEHSFGNRNGPRFDPRDIKVTNDLWVALNQIQLDFEVVLPDYFPKKKFEQRDYPRNMPADDRGWKFMNFTMACTRAAIALIEDAKESMELIVEERPFKYPATNVNGTECYLRYDKYGQKRIVILYIEKLIFEIDFIRKYVLEDYYERTKNSNRNNR